MIDFLDKNFIEDPYPALQELRAQGRPVWHEGVQMYLAARYEDANDVLRTKSLGRIFQSKEPEFEWDVFNWLHADSILDSEPPKHTRLRSLVAKAFNRNKIESQRPAIEKITGELLDAIEIKVRLGQTFDVIADYAEPLPVKVIAALLGFPGEDEYLLRPWSQSIVKMYEVNPTPEHQNEAKAAAKSFADYVHNLMVERKKSPGTDLISDLAAVEESGEKLSAHELVATCVLLLNAGHEASVNAFGNGMVAALTRPDQAELLRTNSREITETAVEEFLRFDAPLHLFERTAISDTDIGGAIVREGEKIASLLGSANRDESIFEKSNDMNLLRNPNPHIGFGAGIHFCLGGPLARLEMGISLPALFERFKDIELASTPKRRPTFVLRGYESVDISAALG